MNNRLYTVIVVPHAEGQFRKFHFSERWLRTLAVVAGCLLLVGVGLAVHYARFYVQLTELRELRRVNAELRRQNLDYEVSTEHLNNRVSSLQDFVTKLAVMAGLDTEIPSGAVGGVGGASDEDSIPAEDSAYVRVRETLNQMATDMTGLEEKSQILERFYEDNTLMLASTPSIWPVRGYLSSTFGVRKDPFTGQREVHEGIDIATPVGRPIVAPADGTVIFATRRGGYGNVVVLDHGFGIMTRYGHLSRYNVAAGKRVKRGDVLGYVGNSGKANGPHLHYEVWVANRAMHPLNYVLEYSKTFPVKETASNRAAAAGLTP
jgi:murein DD-endopeptidase MepM/ murein hydrolase activator NlpD